MFAVRADDTIAPPWVWDGKLADVADVADVVEPLKDIDSPAAVQADAYDVQLLDLDGNLLPAS